jgi:hypothetical protein
MLRMMGATPCWIKIVLVLDLPCCNWSKLEEQLLKKKSQVIKYPIILWYDVATLDTLIIKYFLFGDWIQGKRLYIEMGSFSIIWDSVSTTQ